MLIDLGLKVNAAVRDELFDAVNRGYAVGLQKPTPPVPENINDLDLFLTGLPEKDATRIRTSNRVHGKVLSAARQGDFAEAERLLQIARKILRLESMTRRSYCLALNLIKPLESYVYYKQGDYQKARQLLEQALLFANELRDQIAYQLMDARRVHLACNLMHLEARRGQVREAARIGFGLLRYVDGDGTSWPFPCLVGKAEVPCIPIRLQAVTYNQAAWKLALLFAHGEADDHAVVLAEGEGFVEQNSAASLRQRVILRWLQAKRDLLEGNGLGFLRQAALFFRQGRVVSASWLSLSADVCKVCDAVEGASAQALRQSINENVGTHQVFRTLCGTAG